MKNYGIVMNKQEEYWKSLSINHKLSEKFLKKFENKIYWDLFFKMNKFLTTDIVKSFKHKITKDLKSDLKLGYLLLENLLKGGIISISSFEDGIKNYKIIKKVLKI